MVEQPLTATLGTWSGSQPLTVGLEWLRCDPEGENCQGLGITANTYTVGLVDVGKTIRVKITAANLAGARGAVSDATPVVSALMPTEQNPSIAVAKVTAPHRLVIDQVKAPTRFTGRAIRVTLRVKDSRGFLVEGALVTASTLPGSALVGPAEFTTGADRLVDARVQARRKAAGRDQGRHRGPDRTAAGRQACEPTRRDRAPEAAGRSHRTALVVAQVANPLSRIRNARRPLKAAASRPLLRTFASIRDRPHRLRPVEDALQRAQELLALYEAELRGELPDGADIYDAHVHLGDDIDGMAGRFDELMTGMERYGVSRANMFCLDEPDRHPGFRAANERTLAFAERSSGRLIPFVRLDLTEEPLEEADGASTSAPAESSSTLARSASS